jgi:hypothetical protein
MPWTVAKPPPPAKNWGAREKQACVLAANRVLERENDEQAAIFACIRAAGKAQKTVVVIDKRNGDEMLAPILKYDDFQGLLTGPVLVPGMVDSQGDVCTAKSIKRACSWYNRQRKAGMELDLQHQRIVGDQEARVLKSWTVARDTWMEGNKGRVLVKGGTWLMTVKLLSDRLKEMAKSGEIGYFSVRGVARRSPVQVVRDGIRSAVKRIIRVRKGGPGSGNWGHKGVTVVDRRKEVK